MKINRTWFDGADPHHRAQEIASGTPSFDFFPDGHVEVFVPLDGGPNGHIIIFTLEEAEHMQ
jgi:hypothetical protein